MIMMVIEKIGFKKLQQGIGASSLAKDYFLKAGCCYLANHDLIGSKRAIENYTLEDPSFENDNKRKFLSALLTACEEKDEETFTVTCRNY